MNAKQIVAAAALAVAVFGIGGSAEPTNSGQVGRYQLCSGPHKLVVMDKIAIHNGEASGLYKIDTSTGKTWEYIEYREEIQEGKRHVGGYWKELDDKTPQQE